MLQNNIDCQVSVSTFALYRIIGFVIVLLIDMNQLQLFALDHYQLRFLDKLIVSSFVYFVDFCLQLWLDIGYFFGTLDDIGALSSQNF
uniref:Uncharacterized protein n=1 Tax=Rhizophagus irregularis (strain DAOM 181602 / DAOM 197198 / MUCL 43194) TaxID=747089 RepID=U9UQL4_RHIID